MHFAFTEDQRLLAAGVRDLLSTSCTVEDVALAWTEGPSRARWSALAGVGVVGMLLPEDCGGLGMDEVDMALVLEECGYAGLPEPIAEVAAVAAPLLASSGHGDARRLCTEVAAGAVLLLPALAADPLPAHLESADWLLCQRGDQLQLAPMSAATVTPLPNLDGARPTGTVTLAANEGAEVLPELDADALTMAAARGAWASAAQLVGVSRRMLEMATSHALAREQFGKPIGSFQAVKHHLATALVAVEFARPLGHRAAWSLANGQDDAPLHASMAKAAAAEAAHVTAKAVLQVHGAIGYTWEHPLHLFMKRAWSLSASWGTTEDHWRQIEAATFA